MGTSTKSFGSSKREGHNASGYYDRQLIELPTAFEDPTFGLYLHKSPNCLAKSSEDMSELPDNSVGLMVTSPPYHVGKDYDTDIPFDEYLHMLGNVFSETYRVLEPGAKAVVNAAGLGRKPYIGLHHYVDELMRAQGFVPRGEIIWIKGEGASGSCAWGTFQSAKNPCLRDLHEFLLVYTKPWFNDKGEAQLGRFKEGKSTIQKQDFMDWTLSVWKMRPELASRVSHPAPFPVELPRRCIELFSYENDVVLDPFMGSGTTGVAAVEAARKFVGYDTDTKYVKYAEERIEEAVNGIC